MSTPEGARTQAPDAHRRSTIAGLPGAGLGALGLVLPGLCVLALGAILGSWEQRTHLVSRWLGQQLLLDNDARVPSGAVWEGILAGRRARHRVQDATGGDSLLSATVPLPALRSRYTQEQRSRDFVILTRNRRATALQPASLSTQAVRDLAETMQVYQRGQRLLQALELPEEPFLIHARIAAQIELEEGGLFAALHERLLASGSPSAWDFVQMSAATRAYWALLLRPAVDNGAAVAPDLEHQAPEVAAATASLVSSWADSLRHAEAGRLRQAWEDSGRYEIRLVRNMDRFIGHALYQGERPVQFELPARHVEAVLGLPQRQVEP